MTLRTGVFGGVDVPGVISLGEMVNGALGGPTYAQILRDDFSASEIWPLVNIASGNRVTAFISPDRTGPVGGLVGWDLQDAAGPVPGSLAPYSDGANDYGDIYTSNGSTGLVDIFDPSTGGIFGWATSDEWDIFLRRIWYIFVNNNNRITIARPTLNNTLTFFYIAGGTVKSVANTMSPGSWFSYAMTWNTGADELKCYVDGVQVGLTQNGLGAWVGNPGFIALGSGTGLPSEVWKGYLAYQTVIFGSIWSDADILAMHNAAATSVSD